MALIQGPARVVIPEQERRIFLGGDSGTISLPTLSHTAGAWLGGLQRQGVLQVLDGGLLGQDGPLLVLRVGDGLLQPGRQVADLKGSGVGSVAAAEMTKWTT